MSDVTEKLPVAVWQGTFRLFGVDLRCSVLDSGQRVIDAADVERLFMEMGREDRDYAPGDVEAFARWQRGRSSAE